MWGMAKRKDWPLGPALRAARERAGLSARKAAERTNGLVSSGRWYQLESGVQKAKGQEVPIGTTPETVIAAALAVGWDVDEALRVADMVATESVVRVVETKMFGSDIRVDTEEANWILYLEALLDYIDHHSELPSSEIATLLLECEFLARRAMENQPGLDVGIDESIAYSSLLNTLLTQLRDKQRTQQHGKKEDHHADRPDSVSDSDTTRSPAATTRAPGAGAEDEKTDAARRRKDAPPIDPDPGDIFGLKDEGLTEPDPGSGVDIDAPQSDVDLAGGGDRRGGGKSTTRAAREDQNRDAEQADPGGPEFGA